MNISDAQLIALRNLADKQAGASVGWINISDAEALTAIGLAQRNRAGWEITLAGAFLLKEEHTAARPSRRADVLPFRPRAAQALPC